LIEQGKQGASAGGEFQMFQWVYPTRGINFDLDGLQHVGLLTQLDAFLTNRVVIASIVNTLRQWRSRVLR
jgi:hypothetical protein